MRKIIYILSNWRYLLIFIGFFAVAIASFVAFPAFTIPDNTIAFQISTYNSEDYILLTILALLASLLMTVQIYATKHRSKVCNSVNLQNETKSYFQTFIGWLVAVLSAMLGTATCAACIAPFIAVFGLSFTSIVFLLKYKLFFAIGAMTILIFAIYLHLTGITPNNSTKPKH